jgi:hypothetical protein
MSVILAFRRLRQENHEFEARLVYIKRSYFKKGKIQLGNHLSRKEFPKHPIYR